MSFTGLTNIHHYKIISVILGGGNYHCHCYTRHLDSRLHSKSNVTELENAVGSTTPCFYFSVVSSMSKKIRSGKVIIKNSTLFCSQYGCFLLYSKFSDVFTVKPSEHLGGGEAQKALMDLFFYAPKPYVPPPPFSRCRQLKHSFCILSGEA